MGRKRISLKKETIDKSSRHTCPIRLQLIEVEGTTDLYTSTYITMIEETIYTHSDEIVEEIEKYDKNYDEWKSSGKPLSTLMKPFDFYLDYSKDCIYKAEEIS